MLVFGGMNNNNYLGSSLFVVHLDLNTRPVLETEEEKVVHLLEKNIKSLGHEGMERLKRLKKKALRRELSIIDEIILPPIK